MSKSEFLSLLATELTGLPQKDIDERLNFYSEMIDDRIEDGISEEEAVLAAGTVEDIVAQIVLETPFIKIAKERAKSKRQLKAWEIVLLALGSPIWLSILVILFAVALSLYVSLWSIVISLWAVFAAFIGCSFCGIVSGVAFAFNGFALNGVALIGAGITCAGLSIFTFYGCDAATKGTALLAKTFVLAIKKLCIKKEKA